MKRLMPFQARGETQLKNLTNSSSFCKNGEKCNFTIFILADIFEWLQDWSLVE
jgi:hypothetical protein